MLDVFRQGVNYFPFNTICVRTHKVYNVLKDNQSMKFVYLKPDWDYQPKINLSKGHHVTRIQESTKLIDFIQRSNEGALLLCGERGAGKTSLLYSCINHVNKPQEIIPVLLNAATINKIIESSGDNNSTTITVQHFIRALYSKTKSLNFLSDTLKNEIAELFSKATASQFSNKSEFKLSKFFRQEHSVKINLIHAIIVTASGLLSLFETVEKWVLAPIILGAGITWLSVNCTFRWKKSHSNVASQYLQHDYDLATMQSEFEELLNKLSNKYKIVFVIDELDKLTKQVDFVLSIKMLINQSSARFIFISDPTMLSEITVPKSKESTLFSQYLFLKHPTFNEMDEFLSEIVGDMNFDRKDPDFEIFKKFLLFEARSHFFSLYTMIRDHVHNTDTDGNPVLEFEINPNMTIKANLQKSIEWIYDRRKSPNNSEWQENNTLLTHLYSIAHELNVTPIKTSFAVEDATLKLGNGISIGITAATQTACVNFLEFLVSQGYLKKIQGNTFSTIGEFKKFNSKPGGIFIEEQKSFVKCYEELINLAINFMNVFNNYYNESGTLFSLDNIHSKWDAAQNINGNIPFNSYVTYRDMYLNLRKDSSAYYTSSDLQPKILELQNFLLELQNNLANIIHEIFSKQISNIVNYNIYDNIASSDILNSIGSSDKICKHLVMDYSPPSIILKISKIVFIINPDPDLPELIKNLSLEKTLVVFLSKKPFHNSLAYSSVTKLKLALRESKASNYFLKMKIPIDFSEFHDLISILTDYTLLKLTQKKKKPSA